MFFASASDCHRLQHARLTSGGQAAGIRGQQQIRRGIGAFALQAL
jgi:hypothetical protein